MDVPPDYVPNRDGIPGTTSIVSEDDLSDDSFVVSDEDDDDYEDDLEEYGVTASCKFKPMQLVVCWSLVAAFYILNNVMFIALVHPSK